jgi:uncharacterized protein YprB with RNaseH-like and TPR domain
LAVAKMPESVDALGRLDAQYFSAALNSRHHWRLFPHFRDHIGYLDIETNGSGSDNYITAISLYDGVEAHSYVRDINLDQFADDIRGYKLLVTYNGKNFDIPFIEQEFRMRLDHAHIDLRFLLKSLGITGGLKGCEKKVGIDRQELDGLNGYAAVILWNDYERNGNTHALDTLLAYNTLDTVNLETLLVVAYNMKLAETPFADSLRIPMPAPFHNPFTPDLETISRIRFEYGF